MQATYQTTTTADSKPLDYSTARRIASVDDCPENGLTKTSPECLAYVIYHAIARLDYTFTQEQLTVQTWVPGYADNFEGISVTLTTLKLVFEEATKTLDLGYTISYSDKEPVVETKAVEETAPAKYDYLTTTEWWLETSPAKEVTTPVDTSATQGDAAA